MTLARLVYESSFGVIRDFELDDGIILNLVSFLPRPSVSVAEDARNTYVRELWKLEILAKRADLDHDLVREF